MERSEHRCKLYSCMWGGDWRVCDGWGGECYHKEHSSTLVYGNPAKLRGFVCYCGRKLESVVESGRDPITYTCNHCGRSVVIDRVDGLKVAVIGLGRAGLPLAAVIADSGIEVIGVDVDEDKCRMINSGINPIPEEPGLNELISKYGGTRLKAVTDYERAADCRAYIVIVSLYLDNLKNPDFRIMESAFREVGRILKRGRCSCS